MMISLLILACGTPEPPSTGPEPDVVQAVIDHPQVVPFLHLESHTPLSVFAAPGMSRGTKGLTAGGQPVQVVTDAGAARIRLLSHATDEAGHVRIRFLIPDEGVSGAIEFEPLSNGWRPTDAEVVEHARSPDVPKP